jgi:hypothetical protein
MFLYFLYAYITYKLYQNGVPSIVLDRIHGIYEFIEYHTNEQLAIMEYKELDGTLIDYIMEFLRYTCIIQDADCDDCDVWTVLCEDSKSIDL